jgi:hypothetical protein
LSVTLTGLLPSDFASAVIGLQIGDWSIGAANFGLGRNGQISSVNDVPDGSAFLDLDAIASPIEFTFDSDIFRVGGTSY